MSYHAFHGSPSTFETFDFDRLGLHSGYACSHVGAFFSDQVNTARAWASSDGYVLEAELQLFTPLHLAGEGDDPLFGLDATARDHLGLITRFVPGTRVVSALLPEEHVAFRALLESRGHDGILYRGPTERTFVVFRAEMILPRRWHPATESRVGPRVIPHSALDRGPLMVCSRDTGRDPGCTIPAKIREGRTAGALRGT